MFLERLIRRAIDGSHEPTCQATAELVPQELLKLAKEWRKHPAPAIQRLENENIRPGARKYVNRSVGDWDSGLFSRAYCLVARTEIH